MAESDWIHANVPGAKTFIVRGRSLPDPVAISGRRGLQHHSDGGYGGRGARHHARRYRSRLPGLRQLFGGRLGPADCGSGADHPLDLGLGRADPSFDYAYSWGTQSGDTALSTDPTLQQVFATHNALTSGTGGTGSGGSTGGTSSGGSTGGTSSGGHHHHQSGGVTTSTGTDPSSASNDPSTGSSGSTGSGSTSGGGHHHHDVLNTGARGSEMQSLLQGLNTGAPSGQSSSTAGDPPAPTPPDPPAGDTLKSMGHHALSLLGADDDNAINTLLNTIKGVMHGPYGQRRAARPNGKCGARRRRPSLADRHDHA